MQHVRSAADAGYIYIYIFFVKPHDLSIGETVNALCMYVCLSDCLLFVSATVSATQA